MKYKIGDRVRVVRKVLREEFYWNPRMNDTVGKVYTILYISYKGWYQLKTETVRQSHNFFYLPESLEPIAAIGQQLEFDFMKDAEFDWIEF